MVFHTAQLPTMLYVCSPPLNRYSYIIINLLVVNVRVSDELKRPLMSDGGKEQVTELKPVSENPMSILVDGLDPCTEYEYSVKINMKGILSSSETLTFTTSK